MIYEIIGGIAALFILFLIIVMIYDTHRFVVKYERIESEKITKPYRFVLMSDLHNKQFGTGNEKLLKAIEDLKPEGILIAGDMMTAVPGRNFDDTLRFLEELSARYPVYYGQGNHEHRIKLYPEVYGDMAIQYGQGLKKAGVELLCNGHKELTEHGVVIYGAEIKEECYRHFRPYPMEDNYMESILGRPEKEKFNILLAHNPDYFPQYEAWGADLVLSGHVHGGLMKLPLLGGVIAPTLCLFPKYDGGVFYEKDSIMILSRGLGTHTLPIRIFNPGELIAVELLPKGNGLA